MKKGALSLDKEVLIKIILLLIFLAIALFFMVEGAKPKMIEIIENIFRFRG